MRDITLIVHFIGLAMGIGTSFAFMFLAMAASKMDKAEADKFMIKTFVLARMGHIGLLLLLLSGLHMIVPYWDTIGDNHLLLTKLVLFVVLGGLLGAIGGNARKARAAEDPTPFIKKIEIFGKFTMIIGLTIIVLAVLVFH